MFDVIRIIPVELSLSSMMWLLFFDFGLTGEKLDTICSSFTLSSCSGCGYRKANQISDRPSATVENSNVPTRRRQPQPIHVILLVDLANTELPISFIKQDLILRNDVQDGVCSTLPNSPDSISAEEVLY
jgi:hypothetical protein